MIMMKAFPVIACASVLAFMLGYRGIGSDLRIIKNNDRTIDCFVNGNPCGMNLYGDYSLFANILSAGTQEEITKAKKQMYFYIQMQMNIIKKIEQKYDLEKQKVDKLKAETEVLIERP